MGAPDPRLDANGKVHVSLQRLQRSYQKEDPPPQRVKPIPPQIVRHAVESLQSDDRSLAIADLLIIGVFFLLHPGENTYATYNNHPFRLQDASFELPDKSTHNAVTISADDLAIATKVHLNFTTQKNGEANEAITHGDTSDALLSPLKAVRRRVTHLRYFHVPPDTPLYRAYLPSGKYSNITAAILTATLRASCKSIGSSLGIRPLDISARALRAGGAMALLRANVDPVTIRMIGRWKSWTMIRYLHRSATSTTSFAEQMLTGGNFSIAQHATLPTISASVDCLLKE